ncbi:hypothetical protein HUT16_02340 [Kitasatospora sp. NA04385]|uniref:hypothetical protein n=1 Tax=Kitasatospora sp. NA04385 TaxID=2742135 RepID=UPI0015926308|nr:hypothetical protein [Kitasatospora sp. NA04385]QKW18056.1 hypothetical protein HUT16_02340 [Kitasatospora sp. NA04385]
MPVINEPRRPQGGPPTSAPPRVPEPAEPPGHSSGHSSGRSSGPPPQPVGHQTASIGHQAAAQLLGLREVVLPAAVVAAADLLLGDALGSDDPVTREAAAATRGRLRAALGLA